MNTIKCKDAKNLDHANPPRRKEEIIFISRHERLGKNLTKISLLLLLLESLRENQESWTIRMKTTKYFDSMRTRPDRSIIDPPMDSKRYREPC
jgi:hypothetical protein